MMNPTSPVLLLLSICGPSSAWTVPNHRVSKTVSVEQDEITARHQPSRRNFLAAATTLALPLTTFSAPANALVKGNAPPTKTKASEKLKCTNVEECQEMAAKRDAELREQEAQGPPPSVTQSGVRYRDLQPGDDSKGVVADGDEVVLYYKVLKLGKRSYDGISGEGTVVFSRGYGLEDDEKEPGSKSFVTTVGSFQNILALNDAVVGMNVGGIRRFAIVPQKGWEKPIKACDGGPGGSGAGGELKTDYVVVPTATMVATESCFDSTKLPFPTSYAQERRMAQRFDQSLIMEVQVVGINKERTLLGGL